MCTTISAEGRNSPRAQEYISSNARGIPRRSARLRRSKRAIIGRKAFTLPGTRTMPWRCPVERESCFRPKHSNCNAHDATIAATCAIAHKTEESGILRFNRLPQLGGGCKGKRASPVDKDSESASHVSGCGNLSARGWKLAQHTLTSGPSRHPNAHVMIVESMTKAPSH